MIILVQIFWYHVATMFFFASVATMFNCELFKRITFRWVSCGSIFFKETPITLRENVANNLVAKKYSAKSANRAFAKCIFFTLGKIYFFRVLEIQHLAKSLFADC